MEEYKEIAQQGKISVEVIKGTLGDLCFSLCTERSERIFLDEENKKLKNEIESLKKIVQNLGKENDELKKKLKQLGNKE